VTISLKIEVLKVFSLEFNLSSDKKIKEEKDAKTSNSDTAAKPK
jgi:hypothetical protein